MANDLIGIQSLFHFIFEFIYEYKLLKCFLQTSKIMNFVFLTFFSCFYSNTIYCKRDCRQLTFVMLNGFCLLSKNRIIPTPVINGQYQNGQNTNQNQIKNTCPFYILFQVLRLIPIKICKIQPLDILFLVVFIVFISFDISRYHFSQTFKTSFNIM